MSFPFFSIIIPTYNSELTLSFALESVLSQDFQNYEILVIDGNSKDNTVQVAKMYNDFRIRIFSQPDNGIYDAMNKGLQLTKGEWVYFLGSDDQFFSNCVLSKIEKVCFDQNLDVVYGNVYSSRFNGYYDGVFDYNKILNRNICHQAIFFRNSIFKKVGNFNVQYRVYADWDHNMRWFLLPGIRCLFVNLVIANFSDGGFSSKNRDVFFEKDKLINYLIYAKDILSFKKKLYLICKFLFDQRKIYSFQDFFNFFYKALKIFF